MLIEGMIAEMCTNGYPHKEACFHAYKASMMQTGVWQDMNGLEDHYVNKILTKIPKWTYSLGLARVVRDREIRYNNDFKMFGLTVDNVNIKFNQGFSGSVNFLIWRD